ncbi:glycosyltransferase [Arhodomonas aquaeolei]|uniref:glycosyltransferase n=1 Tax=Arhodomonas aquaeolei TaxID=2369 RepID=UPI00216781D5|nr:glycosyltransferase [Arhodomonas aquaeolei]MCS4503039.1 glycosyltransferase [Arhodomonas aquaeolei]
MKSLHVLGSRQFGGADRFYVRLIQALAAAGHETVAVNRPGSPVAEALAATPAELPVRQYHLPFANKWDLATVLRLRALVRRERPMAVQSYMGRATRLTRVPRRSGAAHIARLGGYYKLDGYYRHCDAWVGNTRGVCDYLVGEGLPRERVFHIGNFVPPPRTVTDAELAALREEAGLPPSARVLFALGRFIGIKGMDDLLRAFARMPGEDRDGRPLRLVIVGDGPLAGELHALAGELGVAGRVHWPGWLDDPEPWFGLADVLVCPSRHETLGNVILEGWNHGLPVVSTRTPGATEIARDGDNALLVPREDPPALAEALERALALDADGRAAMVAAGHAELTRAHGEAAVVEAYVRLYDTLHRGTGGWG